MPRYRVALFVLLFIGFLSSCAEVSQQTTSNITPTQKSTSIGTSNPDPITPTSTLGPTSTPIAEPTLTITPSATPQLEAPDKMAMSYYSAIQEHKYSVAYSYLDTNAIDTITGQKLTEQLFTQLAQDAESASGSISSFSVAVYTPLIVMTVFRGGGPYHAHLKIKQENNAWKIISFDRI